MIQVFGLVHKCIKYRILDQWILQQNWAIKILYKIFTIIFYPANLFGKHKEIDGRIVLEFFKQLGPIYIKLGQTLSTRPDIVGQDFALHLRRLQDSLDPFDFQEVSSILQQQWAAKLEDICASIEQKPVASASVAQVHKARLICGADVAIKILRPGIYQNYSKDLKTLRAISTLLSSLMPGLAKFKLHQIIDVFDQNMQLELNLLLEAANCSELRDNLKDDADICLPEIYWHLTTQDVLVTQWIDGISIYNADELKKNNIDTKAIAAKMAIMFFNQTYRDGFFHADLHPGNIFVTRQGKIALVDFGIMGRLSDQDRFAVAQILHGFLKKDYISVANIHIKAGYIPQETNAALFAQYCRSVCEPIAGLALKEVSISKILTQMFKVIEVFGLQIQPQLVMLQKSMLIIEGIGKTLDPNINMWQLAYPWMENWAIKNISIEARIMAKLKKFISATFSSII